MFSIKDIVELAKQIEKNAAMIYARAASRTSDPVLVNTLKCLVEDERRHARRFAELIKAIPDAEGPPQLEEMGRALMRDVIGEQSFSLGDADFAKLANREDLLSLAIGFTMDKQKFYRLLQSFAADEDAFNTIEAIISEESDHIEHLKQLRDCQRKEKLPSKCALC